MIKKIKDFLFKEKEVEYETGDFAIIRLNENAKKRGVNDNFSKYIQIYRNGNLAEKISYSKASINALKEIEKIPVISEIFDDEEEYNFTTTANFGVVTHKNVS